MANIKLNPGKIAPRYEQSDDELELIQVVVTENGMESDLPLVDLVMKDADGKKHYMMLSGRIMQSIASAIDGVNLRNHGVARPE